MSAEMFYDNFIGIIKQMCYMPFSTRKVIILFSWLRFYDWKNVIKSKDIEISQLKIKYHITAKWNFPWSFKNIKISTANSEKCDIIAI